MDQPPIGSILFCFHSSRWTVNCQIGIEEIKDIEKDMILKNKYPICEFDTSKNPIIQAANFLMESLPEKCVITFLRKELERFVAENNLPVIGYLKSEEVDLPIYEYGNGADRLCITMAMCGGPAAAVALEELYAMGVKSSLFVEEQGY